MHVCSPPLHDAELYGNFALSRKLNFNCLFLKRECKIEGLHPGTKTLITSLLLLIACVIAHFEAESMKFQMVLITLKKNPSTIRTLFPYLVTHIQYNSVTKILHKLRVSTFTENYRKLCVRGG